MDQPNKTRPKESPEASPSSNAFATEDVIKKVAARATAASMKLENREVPAGHVRSDGVEALLAERQARRR